MITKDEKLLGFDEGEFDYIKLRHEMETDKQIATDKDGDETVKHQTHLQTHQMIHKNL